jgi:phage terminase small subunit
MSAIIKQGDLTGLSDRHAAFVIEYIKDFNEQDAAVRAGFAASSGHDLRNREDIDRAIGEIMSRRLDVACIDAEWMLQQLAENHQIARQQGKITASNQALREIGKHAAVDAYSAEKVHIVGDEEVLQALQRGRKRAAAAAGKESDVAPLDFSKPQSMETK